MIDSSIYDLLYSRSMLKRYILNMKEKMMKSIEKKILKMIYGC